MDCGMDWKKRCGQVPFREILCCHSGVDGNKVFSETLRRVD